MSHISNKDYAIVIVDNGSNNQSSEVLESQYREAKNIYVLKQDQNLGFAQGNNVGYDFAKHHLAAEFIICINNDTLVDQPDFLDYIFQKYQTLPFDVLGPDIITLDLYHQNPIATSGYSTKQLQRKINRDRRNLLLNQIGLYEWLVRYNQLKNKRKSTHHEQKKNSTLYQVERVNCVLHGSCLIFSPRYISRFRGFYSKTFLYVEEFILWQVAQIKNLVLVYDPNIQIIHKEDQATNMVVSSSRNKRIFKAKHELHSLRLLDSMIQYPDLIKQDMEIDEREQQ